MSRLLSYYGDDFTGSTDVMEALASHGVETVLFTRLPSAQEFAPFATRQVVGLAGVSRSETPQWMDAHLPSVFSWLKSLQARFCHYKVCSTFDSAPLVGNIGRATEIGARVFAQEKVPLIVGAPQLKRYTYAGHLFADYQGEIYRIDRHPVMSRHPVTPMHEADLRLHLKAQTSFEGFELVDVHDMATQLEAGRRLLAGPGGFVVGSSGVEYALAKALTEAKAISGVAQFESLAPVAQTIVVSGSVSPTTERQILFALANGFESVSVDALALAQNLPEARQEAITSALVVLDAGRNPLIHTALGPASDDGARLNAVPEGRRHIGEGLGAILKALLEKTGLSRAIIAGGDSSSHAIGQLDIFALTTRKPLPATPGSPLCIAHSSNPNLLGLEIALKGGQVGGDDYFTSLRDGTLRP
jgi:uncharacterized protein YgbK (DUF1537 family)